MMILHIETLFMTTLPNIFFAPAKRFLKIFIFRHFMAKKVKNEPKTAVFGTFL